MAIALASALAAMSPTADFVDRVDVAAQAAVQARLIALGRQMSVTLEPSDRAWPAGANVVEAKVTGPFPRTRVPVAVRLGYMGSTRTAVVWAILADRRSATTYAAAYPRGTPANRVATSQAVVDLVGVSGTLQKDLPATAVLAHAVTGGSPVLAEDFKADATVHAGDQLDVEASAGSVTLHSPARALESGAAGDRIQVRMEAPSRAVAVRIIGKGRGAADE